MLDTSARLLRLLSVLQARRFWPGSQLAAELEVTPRTMRRDIDRLRQLGYCIDATAGPGGGYQLGTGTAMPPLLLTGDEGVAVALALRVAADSFHRLNDTVVGVLVKLEQLLPKPLRRRISALEAATVSMAGRRSDLDPHVLTSIAAACRDRISVRFSYVDQQGNQTRRHVEPLKVVHAPSRQWYLVAWDRDREALRLFRIDRVTGEPRPGARFVPRNQPDDVEAFVTRGISHQPYRIQVCVRLHGSAEQLRPRIPSWIGELKYEDDGHCLLHTGASTVEYLLCNLILTGTRFELVEPLDFAPKLRAFAQTLLNSLPDATAEAT